MSYVSFRVFTKHFCQRSRLGDGLVFETRQLELLLSKDKEFIIYSAAEFITSSPNKSSKELLLLMFCSVS